MNMKKLLNSIDEDECVLLSHELGEAIVDKDDKIKNIDCEEHIYIQGEDMTIPIPCKEFNKATIYKKIDLVMKIMMEEL